MISESPQSESKRIARQLRASYLGPAWHGPSLTEVLDGITPEAALRKPIASAHSIHEIVLHVAFWAEAVRRTVEGHPYVHIEPPLDWPAPNGAWQDALAMLDHEQRAMVEAIRGMQDARLGEVVTESKGYSFYVLLHGLVQHNLYHAGQIAMLRKA